MDAEDQDRRQGQQNEPAPDRYQAGRAIDRAVELGRRPGDRDTTELLAAVL
jgi:hypothetical protein